jgi:DNA recombination protein RmuC
MSLIIPIATVVLLILVLLLQVLVLRRRPSIDLSPIEQRLDAAEKLQERCERSTREEIARCRQEMSAASQQARQELGAALKAVGDTLVKNLLALKQANDQRLDKMRETVELRLHSVQEENTKKLDQLRQDSATAAKSSREEMAATLKGFSESLVSNIAEMAKLQKDQLDLFSQRLDRLTQTSDQKLTGVRDVVEQRLTLLQSETAKKLDQTRQESTASSQKAREEMAASLKMANESVVKTIGELGSSQRAQLGNVAEQLTKLTESNEKRMDALRGSVEEKLKQVREDNNKQLELVRQTVDEKLQGTLEKRLGESFKLVSDRLEQVHKGLGEMQSLATGVGDLKKVLTNVKSRGTWGEVQLGAMLEQVLTTDQYAENVCTKEGREVVEYAIKLPGRSEDKDEVVWLPIDSKFPTDDYQRLLDAQERADAEAAEQAGKDLENRIKGCAWDICEKYLNPPKTTDFGILFLPTEGLFAEVVRRAGLTEFVQRECRVMIAGPTTLWALLSSLQMGFKTLAIQKRSSEVWNLLSAVKTEWSKYGDVLVKVQKKLQEASNTIDQAQTRNRAIGRKLKGVQELSTEDAGQVLMLEMVGDDGELESES